DRHDGQRRVRAHPADVMKALAAIALAACGSPRPLATPLPDAPVDAARATTIRVHYPAGHAIAIRGSGGGLSWSAGTLATPAGDVAELALPALAAPIEWKPLLDDATWARGPNYRVAPGQTVDIYPHFT